MALPFPRLVRCGDVAERAIGGETVLVPIRRSTRERVSVLTLNEVGSHVWSLLREPRTVAELAATVCAEFEVDEAHARPDVESFVARLRELGLAREA